MAPKDKDGKDGKKGGKGAPGLSRADLTLWQRFTQDIRPFRPADPAAEDPDENSAPAPGVRETIIPTLPVRSAPPRGPGSGQMDRRTEERLRKGQMEIEGRLDLHGHTQARAHDALRDFVMAGHRRGLRCLLIITGKGRSGVNEQDEWHFNDGVLRQRVPEWLSVPPLSDVVLRHFSAQPRDGGEGAYYIYLRRQRDYSP